MRKQKGQAIVEFALVLPLFLMLVFGIIYTGLLYSDYLTLSNLARESARVASIEGADVAQTVFQDTERHPALLTKLYTLESINIIETQIAASETNEDSNNDSVQVTLTVRRDASVPALVEFMLPERYKIIYSMYKEPSS